VLSLSLFFSLYHFYNTYFHAKTTSLTSSFSQENAPKALKTNSTRDGFIAAYVTINYATTNTSVFSLTNEGDDSTKSRR